MPKTISQKILLVVPFVVLSIAGTLHFQNSVKEKFSYRRELLTVKNELHSRATKCAEKSDEYIKGVCKANEFRFKQLGYETPDRCLTEIRSSLCGRYYDVLNVK